MKKQICIAIFVIAFIEVAAFTQSHKDERFIEIANNIVISFNSKNFEATMNDFSKKLREALPPEKFIPFLENIFNQLGKINTIELLNIGQNDIAVYKTHFEYGILNMKLVLDKDNKVTGFIFEVQRNTTELSLPFHGKWFVFWGGDNEKLNYHNVSKSQKYAFDFIMINKKGQSFKTDGKTNEDYYAFGQEIVSPCDAIVKDVINVIRDNTPKEMNKLERLGNAVILKTNKEEYLFFAHLKQGSVKVKVGDKVKKGELLGLCGNSGNSSESHLHFHIQDTYDNEKATGIKCYFKKIKVKNLVKESYSPIKGDLISQE